MNTWSKWLRQPQQLLLRKMFFQVHLWLGIAFALYTVMISLTGSLLVYRREVAAAATIAYVTPREHRLTAQELADSLRRSYPGFTIDDISVPRVRGQIIPDQAIDVQLRRGDKTVARFIDPYTGADLGRSGRPIIIAIVWLAQLHDDLLAPTSKTGRIVNGVGAIGTTILAFTGLILWWPGIRNWKRSLTFQWKRKRFGFHWSLHTALGFWTLLFVVVWGISGIYLCFPKPFNDVVEYLEPQSGRNARVGEEILSWLAKLHFGRFSGLTIKAIWTLVGLAPAVLAITGFMMWWYRVLRRERRSLSTAKSAPRPLRGALADKPPSTV